MSNPYDQAANATESIYQAPSAATEVAPADDLLAAYLGPKNAGYYSQHFDRFNASGGGASWNWPAFFISSIWFLYRKMWLNALLYWLVLPLALIVASSLISMLIGATAAGLIHYVSYFVIAFVLVPMFANSLYHKHAQRKIQKVATSTQSAEEQRLQAARMGGTSNVVLIVVPVFMIAMIGVLAAIAIPAYQDYEIRAQVAEGLALSATAKAAIEEQFDASGTLAADNDSAGISPPAGIKGRYTQSVEIVDGQIFVAYGNQAHQLINGKTLTLYPTESEDGSVEWRCHSADIRAAQLPAMCRKP